MNKQLYKVSEGDRSLTMYQCENGHNFHSYHFSENQPTCNFCETLEQRKAIEEKHSIVIGDEGEISCAKCDVEVYNPFDFHSEDFSFECCCCEDPPKSKRKRHNLKRREKAKARKAERRATLLAANGGLIGAIVTILETEKPELTPDIYMIKGILDKIEFPNLCNRLALLDDEDLINTLQGVAESRKWNRVEQKYLETILTLACVLAKEDVDSA